MFEACSRLYRDPDYTLGNLSDDCNDRCVCCVLDSDGFETSRCCNLKLNGLGTRWLCGDMDSDDDP